MYTVYIAKNKKTMGSYSYNSYLELCSSFYTKNLLIT